MADALVELEQTLRSRQGLTSQEANVLMSYKANAMRSFTVGAIGGAAISWLATGRLNYFYRINFTAGAGGFLGLWRFSRSLDSCVDHILSMEGSRMQNVLANIMLRKYQDNPQITQRISKHFYSENVYDDTSLDQPKLRWRYRNFFGESVDHSQRTNDGAVDDESESARTDSSNQELNQVHMKASIEVMDNPFDCVFGFPMAAEEISQSEATSIPKRHSRHQKRSHRRHRMRHQEVPSA